LQRLLGGPRHVVELALAIAFLAEVSTVEQLVLDLLKGQAATGGVFRPRQIRAMKIAAYLGSA
jgi:hypothetical protein